MTKYNLINTNGYGWAGMPPSVLAERLSLAKKRFKKLLKSENFDAIAFSGSSGCALAFSIAATLTMPLIYVRKQGEKSHGSMVECNNYKKEIKTYLIVDDFVDTGNTVEYIVERIKEFTSKQGAFPAKPIGVLCFDPYQHRDMKNNVLNLTLYTSNERCS